MAGPDVELKQIVKDIESPTIEREKREMKEQWLTENPGRGSADFETYRGEPEFKRWETETRDWTKVTGNYWSEQLPKIDVLKNLDVQLKISQTFSGGDGQSKLVYEKLMNRFDKKEFFGANKPTWQLPDAVFPEWRTLAAKKEAQVQRSAQDLSSVISRTKVLAKEEMSGATVNVADTTKSAFESALENIEKALKQWDTLLSESASPDRRKLLQVANELDNRLDEFSKAHAQLFAENTTPPYIKLEVLATVKAVSEKVASQFSARVAEPNLTGIYSRIIDVPRSTPEIPVNQGCKDISSTYNGNLVKFWESNLGKLRGVVPKYMKWGTELSDAIFNTSKQYPMADSLTAFRDSYLAVRPDNLSWIPKLSSSVAEITFRIAKYQRAVEEVCAKRLGYAGEATAQVVLGQSRLLFDTVTQYIEHRVEVLNGTTS